MRSKISVERRLESCVDAFKRGKDSFGNELSKNDRMELRGEVIALSWVLNKDQKWQRQHNWIWGTDTSAGVSVRGGD